MCNIGKLMHRVFATLQQCFHNFRSPQLRLCCKVHHSHLNNRDFRSEACNTMCSPNHLSMMFQFRRYMCYTKLNIESGDQNQSFSRGLLYLCQFINQHFNSKIMNYLLLYCHIWRLQQYRTLEPSLCVFFVFFQDKAMIQRRNGCTKSRTKQVDRF